VVNHPAAQNNVNRFKLTSSIKLILVLAIVCLAALLLFPKLYTREQKLNGLLVDLELTGPDPGRYKELRDALTQRLQSEVASLQNLRVALTYVHFSELDNSIFKSAKPDFLVLSPQSTPWYMYRDKAGSRLQTTKELVKQVISDGKIPVLGICGGHQFLAITFGGRVDFIDPRFQGSYPERYPKEAMSERGLVSLRTLKADPILNGVAGHPGVFQVMESHYEEVKAVPPPFINVARSEMSEAQLIRIPGKKVYGLAFHPERGWDAENDLSERKNAGRQILANFLTMVAHKDNH
jgi:GMP synthase-like glutamine amidotransferase